MSFLLKYVTFVYDDYRKTIRVSDVSFFIRNKPDISNVVMFKYSLRGFRETIKTPEIPKTNY